MPDIKADDRFWDKWIEMWGRIKALEQEVKDLKAKLNSKQTVTLTIS